MREGSCLAPSPFCGPVTAGVRVTLALQGPTAPVAWSKAQTTPSLSGSFSNLLTLLQPLALRDSSSPYGHQVTTEGPCTSLCYLCTGPPREQGEH